MKTYTKAFPLRITDPLWEKIMKESAKQGISANKYINMVLEEKVFKENE